MSVKLMFEYKSNKSVVATLNGDDSESWSVTPKVDQLYVRPFIAF